jgi:hypothetical protein
VAFSFKNFCIVEICVNVYGKSKRITVIVAIKFGAGLASRYGSGSSSSSATLVITIIKVNSCILYTVYDIKL